VNQETAILIGFIFIAGAALILGGYQVMGCFLAREEKKKRKK